MKLALDAHYSPKIAALLRDRGHDVVALIERGWHADPDDLVLEHCRREKRALLTNNIADLILVARAWAAEGRSHAGIICTSDATHPRNRRTIGRYVEALGKLLHEHRAGFADRILWL